MIAITKDELEVLFIEKGQHSKRFHIGEEWQLNGKEIREVIATLNEVHPPYKTETKMIKWSTRAGDTRYECKACHYEFDFKTNYCANCGALFVGVE